MAGKSLGTLTLDLVAKTGSFTGPMDKAARQTKKNSDQMAKAGKAIGIGIAAGASVAAAGMLVMIQRERELIDQQAKTAQQLDTTYESMANLRRAGELGGVGFEKIETAGRTLNTNIGKAIQGVTAQADAFDRLGVSAQEIYDLPLDERIAKINQALIDNVQASERGAVAADIFGSRNAAAIQQLDPGTIAEAARQVEIFGLNLSDVDAAKVEMANDAMSTFGLLTDGVGKQLTVQLAPILKALGDEFLRSAEEAGGLGQVVSDVVDSAVPAIGFVISAADGVARGFSIAADTIVGTFATAELWVNRIGADILEMISQIPGIDLSVNVESMRADARLAAGVAAEAAASIQQSLLEPLAGEKFERFIRNAVDAGNEAAKAVVQGRNIAHEGGEAFDDAAESARVATNAIADHIAQLELQVATLAMDEKQTELFKLALDGATESQLAHADALLTTIGNYERQAEAQKAAADQLQQINQQARQIQDALATEEEAIQASYERRREIIIKNTEVTGQAQTELLRRLEEERADKLLDINGSYWERWLDAAEDSLSSFDELTASVVENFSGQMGDAFESMIFDAETLEQAFAGIAESMLRSIVNALGQMASQWLAYQAVQLLVGKTIQASGATALAANAQASSILSGINAFSSTAAIPIVGPAMAPGAMAAALAVTEPMAAAVAAAGLAGMAHDGIDSIPATGSWYLEKGERVTTAETSAKLDSVLDDIRGSRAGRGGSGEVHVGNIDLSGIRDSREARRAEASVRRAVAQGVAQAQRYR
tara:strand:- start:2045 stop:4363 length:2319 start_codon:yes stop_codon:yes gene_type:complete